MDAPRMGEVIELDGGGAVTVWSDDAPIIGFQVEPFNWRLRRAREAKGWSRAELARQIGMNPTVVGAAERLRRVSENARWKMALALGVPEDVLFPDEIDALPKDGPPQIELSMTREDIRSVEAPDPHAQMIEGAERRALVERIGEALGTLAPRAKRVIELRFGLDGKGPRSLEEVGHEFGVSHERIRQLESEALRKLRHPSRAKPLRPFLPGGESDAPARRSTVLYTDWLYDQRGRDDAVGRHARDVFSRECCVGWSAAGLRQHLERAHGIEAGAVLKDAADELNAWRRQRDQVIRRPADPPVARLKFTDRPRRSPKPPRPKPPTPKPAPRPAPPQRPAAVDRGRAASPRRTEEDARASLSPDQLAVWEALNATRRRLGLPEVWG
jgi:RNA polymerase sigma factor (sigma-70 family)